MAARGRPTLPRAERRTIVRDELLEAVTTLLADGTGYADVSINAIVAEAGLAKSTFYHYFTGKHDLLRALIDRVIEDTHPRDAWLAFDGPPSEAALERSINRRVAAYLPFLSLMAAAFDAAYIDPDVRATVDELMALLNDAIEAHVRTGQRDGWIDPTLPPAETAIWLNWMVSRGLHQLVLGADEQRATTLVTGFSRIVWSALYAHPTA